MHTTNLRSMSGSVMLAVPPDFLESLRLGGGDVMDIGVENGCLIVQPKKRTLCTLDQLLEQCAETVSSSYEDRSWIDDKPIGDEFL
ncbi:MAG: antitoxin [Rhodobacteraceae bacterium]|nr:antitoxin [Paracoccaceae bacterium]